MQPGQEEVLREKKAKLRKLICDHKYYNEGECIRCGKKMESFYEKVKEIDEVLKEG